MCQTAWTLPERRVRSLELDAVSDSRPVSTERLIYTYDYGDNWPHDVSVEEVRDGDPDIEYPAFVYGAMHCPPEDVGGPHGFMEFVKADLDPAHEQHRDMVRWYTRRRARPCETLDTGHVQGAIGFSLLIGKRTRKAEVRRRSRRMRQRHVLC